MPTTLVQISMITAGELSILQAISRRSLVKKSDLIKMFQGLDADSVGKSIEILKDSGLIDILAPMGETSLAVTQKGMRAISEGAKVDG